MQLTKLTFMILALTGMICIGCNTTQGIATSNQNEKGRDVENKDVNQELVDLLRRVPGLNVRGNAYNVEVTIRGAKSIEGDNNPLYVFDGVPLGRDYSSVARSIDINEVASIRVLTGAQAGLYGFQGANGVIVIKKKK